MGIPRTTKDCPGNRPSYYESPSDEDTLQLEEPKQSLTASLVIPSAPQSMNLGTHWLPRTNSVINRPLVTGEPSGCPKRIFENCWKTDLPIESCSGAHFPIKALQSLNAAKTFDIIPDRFGYRPNLSKAHHACLEKCCNWASKLWSLQSLSVCIFSNTAKHQFKSTCASILDNLKNVKQHAKQSQGAPTTEGVVNPKNLEPGDSCSSTEWFMFSKRIV